MMKIVRKIAPVFAVVALLAAGVYAQAPGPDSGDGPATTPTHHWHHHPMMADGVPLRAIFKGANLTDEQRQQIKQIFQTRHAQMKVQFEQLKSAHEQLAAKYFAAGQVSSTDLAPLLSQISQTRDQMNQARLDDAIAIRNLLTPEQVASAGQAYAAFQQEKAQMRAEKKVQCQAKSSGQEPPAPPADDPADQ